MSTAFVTAKFASVNMVVTIIPTPIAVSVVWRAVSAVAVASDIMFAMIGTVGYIDTSNYTE